MKKILLALLFLPLATTAQETLDLTQVHDGITREYAIYIPAIYSPDTHVPLILSLHGYTSNNGLNQMYTGFQQIADTANFFISHKLHVI